MGRGQAGMRPTASRPQAVFKKEHTQCTQVRVQQKLKAPAAAVVEKLKAQAATNAEDLKAQAAADTKKIKVHAAAVAKALKAYAAAVAQISRLQQHVDNVQDPIFYQL